MLDFFADPYRTWAFVADDDASQERDMIENEREWMERVRQRIHTLLAALTPEEAKALRARFGISAEDSAAAEEEGTLLAMARELAILKKQKF